MSLYTRGQPASTHQFRENTAKNAGQMIGITSTPKRCLCIRCNARRTEVTGKHTKAGFVCHGCRGGSAR